MIQKFEELSMNAFPALHTAFVNGWILRFAKGYSKRANSVNLIFPCSIDISENIALCEQVYGAKGLNTVFKLTESEACCELDQLLAERGYAYEAKTNILLKGLRDIQLAEQDKAGVQIFTELNEVWFAAFTCMNKVKEKDKTTLWKMLQNITAKTYFACITEAERIIAVGLGVAERGYVGMYDIYVHDDHRRKGLGERVMKNLMHQAFQEGCSYTYLQVIDDNEPAKALYAKLGYEKQYSYWYRVKKL